MELLGVFSISKSQRDAMQNMIDQCYIVDFNDEIKRKTIQIKQKYKIKLPDAIIASTAIISDIPLITADADFKAIKELNLILLEQ